MTKSSYKKELDSFLSNKIFIWTLTIISVVCYGYAATNTTVGIDDIQGDLYFGSGNIMLAAGRFGMTFWSRVTGFGDAMPPYTFAIEVLAIVLFIWSAINFCILFGRVSKWQIDNAAINIFAVLLVSYPLMNEIWEYSGANLVVCAGYWCVSLIMLFLQDMIANKKIKLTLMVTTVALMTLVAAGYESLVVVYIFTVTAVIFLQVLYQQESFKWKNMFAQIGIYMSVLLAGLIGEIVVGKLILVVFQLEETTNGATSIMWGNASAKEVIKNLITGMINQYVLRAIIYFPLMELWIAFAVFGIIIVGCVIKRRNGMLLLPGVGAMVSIFLLALVQGTTSPYRTCQVFAIFVAFVALLIVEGLKKKRYLKNLCVCLFAILAINQAMYLSYYLNLNHLRSEEEMAVLKDVGMELESYGNTKPVIFLGKYTLSNYITEACSVERESKAWEIYTMLYAKCNHVDVNDIFYNGDRKIVSTNVRSVINWAIEPVGGQTAMKRLMHYLGYEYVFPSEITALMDLYYLACDHMLNNYWNTGVNPEWKDGYAIIDAQDYLIVHFR